MRNNLVKFSAALGLLAMLALPGARLCPDADLRRNPRELCQQHFHGPRGVYRQLLSVCIIDRRDPCVWRHCVRRSQICRFRRESFRAKRWEGMDLGSAYRTPSSCWGIPDIQVYQSPVAQSQSADAECGECRRASNSAAAITRPSTANGRMSNPGVADATEPQIDMHMENGRTLSGLFRRRPFRRTSPP